MSTPLQLICQFPFIYKNRTYSECTNDGHHKPWCATGKQTELNPFAAIACITILFAGVDQHGHVGRMRGECRPDCPGHKRSVNRCLARDGWPCVFPFEYGDTVQRSCVQLPYNPITKENSPSEEAWCSFLNYANGTVWRWQPCRYLQQCRGMTAHQNFIFKELYQH